KSLWIEHLSGYTAYKNDINSFASSYISGNPHWPMYNPSWAEVTPNNNTLFNFAITYAKGACVLHMLRYVLNDSAIFFNCLRGYFGDTANFKYKNAVTDDFTAKISAVAGQDLSWFVNEWVKQVDHPVYANIYQFTGGGSSWNVGFQANQTQGTTPFHRMPLTLRITFSTGPDTTFRVDNNVNNQVWWWTFNRQPTAFAFDPNNDIVLKQGTTTQGTITGISVNNNGIPKRYALHQNYPNPFNPVTKIRFDLPEASSVELKVYDLTGRVVSTIFKGNMGAGEYTADFDALNVASGVYYYEIYAKCESKGIFKDVKKMVVLK